jgi:hypothetical protein
VTAKCMAYCFGVLLLSAPMSVGTAAQDVPTRPNVHGILENDFRAPISFEPNLGQTDKRVKFMARGSGYDIFLTQSDALLSFAQTISSNDLLPHERDVITLKIVGANPSPNITGRDELPGTSSYFVGSDPSHWHTEIRNYSKVEYQNIYPGIDLVYHAIQGQLEYDFVVHAGAKPSTILIEFKGTDNIRLSSKGELVLQSRIGEICFHPPIAYQLDQGKKRVVFAHYRRVGERRVGFSLGAYDATQLLVIDPPLAAPVSSTKQVSKPKSVKNVFRPVRVPGLKDLGLCHATKGWK